MAKMRSNGLPSYGIPYPMSSAVGRRKAEELISGYASALARLYGKALTYGHEELSEHVNTLLDYYGRIMNPAEQQLNAAKGLLGVYHAGALGYGTRGLMDAQEALSGLQAKPGSFTTPAERPLPLTPIQPKPLPIPGTIPFPAPPKPLPPAEVIPFKPQPVPCPKCNTIVFCPPPPPCPPVTVNLACPACNCTAICRVQITYIINLIQQVLLTLNCTPKVSTQTIVNIVNNIIQQEPPPAPLPTEAAALGKDCDHALHMCLCGPPGSDICLGADAEHPLWIGITIDPGRLPICPAPSP